MLAPIFPEPPSSIEATPLSACDAIAERLHAAKDRWAALPIPKRIAALRACIDGMGTVGEAWTHMACKAKGHAAGSVGEGEEWLAGVMPVVRNLRLLIEALEADGQPKLPKTWRRSDGQWVAQVFPTNLMDKALFTGHSAEIWIEPGEKPTQGRIYRERDTTGGVSLVLGAGNQASIGPMDVLYKLFVENEVAILKMNPVNDYLGPFIEQAFKPLVELDAFAVVYGGAEVGAHLCKHALVDTIHITGSAATHDVIIWGPGSEEEVAARKERGEKALDKPITSELGCVTPVIIVPGPWSDAEIDFQARHVTSMVTHNASFNCNAGKVVVIPGGWDKKERFLSRLRHHLSRAPLRKAYYPGAQDRYDAFLEKYPDAEMLGERSDTVVPWTLIPAVKPGDSGYALTHEAFCGVLALTEIDASTPEDFLRKAVPFCNDTLWGTLSCTVLIHPKTEKAHAAAFDRAIADLRYGGIGVNAWSGVVYGLVVTTWGAFPGHTLEDIRSGIGVVHNTFLLDHPQKSIVRAPFIIRPTPAWFFDHGNLPGLGKKLSSFEASPSWLKVAAVAAQALRG